MQLIPGPDFPGGGQIISQRSGDPRRVRERAAAA